VKIATPDKRKPLDRQAPDVLLALCLYHEARGEGEDGLAAVAWVIRNRAARPCWWGKTLPQVILKPKQFSCFNGWKKSGGRLYAVDLDAYGDCYEIGAQVVAGLIADPTEGATHYCRHDCWPKWRAELKFIKRIGAHVFYK